MNFHYNVGDFLFDAMTYLLKYSISSNEFLHVLCHGKANEKHYIKKTSMSTLDGGL